jgi:four helix bundle protein
MLVERPIDQFVSGLEGMAGRHDLGGVLLSIDTPISTRRALRTDISDQARGRIAPANIAEGHGREHTGSFVQHLRISQGSLKELETHLLLAEPVGIPGAADLQPILTQCESIGKMIRTLIRSLQQKASSQ